VREIVQMIAAIYEQGVFKPLQPVQLTEGQHVTLSVEETAKGSPAAILRVMRQLPDLNPEDIDELERVIAEGKLPVRLQSVFEEGKGEGGSS
jgi:predicted DNA-binding antitoxin AbrB/MazE fold protein